MNEVPPFNPIPHLKRLLEQFEELTARAIEFQSPNPDDDELIRCGIIGFAFHASCDDWDVGHFKYVRNLRDEVLKDAFSEDWRRFTCLAAGYFLGMWRAGLIDDRELHFAEAITPGYMWSHSDALNLTDGHCD